MKTPLADDYLIRANKRTAFVRALMNEKAWADSVCESHKIIELALKGLLKKCGVEVPRVHDVSAVLVEEKARLPAAVHKEVLCWPPFPARSAVIAN